MASWTGYQSLQWVLFLEIFLFWYLLVYVTLKHCALILFVQLSSLQQLRMVMAAITQILSKIVFLIGVYQSLFVCVLPEQTNFPVAPRTK